MFRLQLLTETSQSATQIALHRAEGLTGRFGYLTKGEIIEIVHRDNLASPIRKTAQSFRHQQAVCDGINTGLYESVIHGDSSVISSSVISSSVISSSVIGSNVIDISVSATKTVSLLGPDIVDDPIFGNRNQPTGQRSSGGLISHVALPSTDKHFLDHILGAALVEGSTTEGVDEAAVALVGRLEGTFVATSESLLNALNLLAPTAHHYTTITTASDAILIKCSRARRHARFRRADGRTVEESENAAHPPNLGELECDY